MSDTYNLYNLEAPFKQFLLAGNQKPVSVKNYLSDFRHFAGWIVLYVKSKQRISTNFNEFQFISIIDERSIIEYKSYLSENNIPHKTINRRLSTVRKFCSFCISQGWLKENPAKRVSNVLPSRASETSRETHEDILKVFRQDLLKQNLDSKTVNSYLSDVREFLGLV